MKSPSSSILYKKRDYGFGDLGTRKLLFDNIGGPGHAGGPQNGVLGDSFLSDQKYDRRLKDKFEALRTPEKSKGKIEPELS